MGVLLGQVAFSWRPMAAPQYPASYAPAATVPWPRPSDAALWTVSANTPRSSHKIGLGMGAASGLPLVSCPPKRSAAMSLSTVSRNRNGFLRLLKSGSQVNFLAHDGLSAVPLLCRVTDSYVLADPRSAAMRCRYAGVSVSPPSGSSDVCSDPCDSDPCDSSTPRGRSRRAKRRREPALLQRRETLRTRPPRRPRGGRIGRKRRLAQYGKPLGGWPSMGEPLSYNGLRPSAGS